MNQNKTETSHSSGDETAVAQRVARAGFIGVGNFISGKHLPNIAASPLWRVEAVCDLDPAARERAAARYAPRYTTEDYRRLLDDPAIDAVILGVQHQHHLPSFAKRRGSKQHCWSKSDDSDREESRRSWRAVRDAGVKLMSGSTPLRAAGVEAKRLFHGAHHRPPGADHLPRVDNRRFGPTTRSIPRAAEARIRASAALFISRAGVLDVEPERSSAKGTGRRKCASRCVSRTALGPRSSSAARVAAYPKVSVSKVFCESTTLVLDQHLWLQAEGYVDLHDMNEPGPPIRIPHRDERAHRTSPRQAPPLA